MCAICRPSLLWLWTLFGEKMKKVALLLALGFLFRLALAIFTQGNYDLRSYEIVAQIVHAGGNVYAQTTRYNYSPVWSLLIGGITLVPIPLHISVRVFLSIVDMVNALLIWKIAGRKMGLLYAFNPISIIIVGYGGQFETLAALPILLALAYKRNTWLLCALAVLIKHDLVFIVWTVLFYRYGVRRSIAAMLGIVAVFLMSFLSYREALPAIVQNVFLYRSIEHVYGLSLLIPNEFYVLLIVMAFLPIILRRRMALLPALTATVLVQFVLMSGFGQQYWILLPLFTFADSMQARVTTSVIALGLFIAPLTELFGGADNAIFTNAGWIACVAWLISGIHIRSPLRTAPPVPENA